MKSEKTKKEFVKLKEMPFKDKCWYIWEYYKIHIITVVASIFFIVSMASSILNQTEIVFTCYAVNKPIYDEPYDKMKEDFSIYASIQPEEWEFDSTMIIEWEGESGAGYEYVMKLSAVMASAGLDVLLGDESTINHFSGMSGLMDLETFLPASLVEQYQGDFIYATDEEGNTYACALMLTDSPVLEATGMTKPIYYSVIANSSHPEKSIQFLEYLLLP